METENANGLLWPGARSGERGEPSADPTRLSIWSNTKIRMVIEQAARPPVFVSQPLIDTTPGVREWVRRWKTRRGAGSNEVLMVRLRATTERRGVGTAAGGSGTGVDVGVVVGVGVKVGIGGRGCSAEGGEEARGCGPAARSMARRRAVMTGMFLRLPNVRVQRRAQRVRCNPRLDHGGRERRRKLRRGFAGGTF